MTWALRLLFWLELVSNFALTSAMAQGIPVPRSQYQVMVEIGTIPAPEGWRRFCVDYPANCTTVRRSRPIILNDARWAELEQVNAAVNAAIAEADDGSIDSWDLPTSTGDCEDFVLLKRKQLIERRWPAGALLVTAVRLGGGQGHAVLTVRTDRGEFVLDNRTDEVREWVEIPYVFTSRQSAMDPNVWAALAQ